MKAFAWLVALIWICCGRNFFNADLSKFLNVKQGCLVDSIYIYRGYLYKSINLPTSRALVRSIERTNNESRGEGCNVILDEGIRWFVLRVSRENQ